WISSQDLAGYSPERSRRLVFGVRGLTAEALSAHCRKKYSFRICRCASLKSLLFGTRTATFERLGHYVGGLAMFAENLAHRAVYLHVVLSSGVSSSVRKTWQLDSLRRADSTLWVEVIIPLTNSIQVRSPGEIECVQELLLTPSYG